MIPAHGAQPMGTVSVHATDTGETAVHIRMLASVMFGSAMLLSGSAHGEWADDAMHAAERGNITEAVQLLQPHAEAGDPIAERIIGAIKLAVGQYQAALVWLNRAAKQDDPPAQGALGVIYDNGLGVARDHIEAARW